MRKNYAYLSFFVIIGVVLSGFAYVFTFAGSVWDLIYELCVAVFTGCIFAIPSGIIVLCENVAQNNRILIELLRRLEQALNDFEEDALNSCDVNLYAHDIRDIEHGFGEIVRINLFSKKKEEKIDELREELFLMYSLMRDEQSDKLSLGLDKELMEHIKNIKDIVDYIRKFF